ncbi:MAG TPA: cytochrome c-type biogenesis protein [Chloroflexota bacterium]|nr:cytochrome c-type biogenesis protein [Chloroflexota bacterium]
MAPKTTPRRERAERAPGGRAPRLAWAALAVLAAVLLVPAAVAQAQTSTATQREAQEIARTLKCPVCESQSVADSPSQLAQEMRGYIERRLEAGESRDAIVQDLTDRYGEGILLEPPRRGFTLIVWWLPIVSLGIGAVVVALTLRRATRRAGGASGAADGAGTPTLWPEGSVGLGLGVAEEPAAEMAPEELARYRAQLAEELARRERGLA